MLQDLNEADRRKLYATLAEQYGRAGGKSVQFTDEEQLVWDAICEVMGSKRQLTDVLTRAGKDYTRASYADDVDELMSWLDAGCRERVNRTQRIALIGAAVDCLARYVGSGPAPLVHKTLVQQLCKAAWALDRAFPGYQDARLLDRIVAIAVAA